jgi:hypothetical protein
MWKRMPTVYRVQLGCGFGIVFLSLPLQAAGVPDLIAVLVGVVGILPLALAVIYISSFIHGIEPKQRADGLKDFFAVDDEVEQAYIDFLHFRVRIAKIIIGAMMIGTIPAFVAVWLFPGLPVWGVLLLMIAASVPAGWYIVRRYPPDQRR